MVSRSSSRSGWPSGRGDDVEVQTVRPDTLVVEAKVVWMSDGRTKLADRRGDREREGSGTWSAAALIQPRRTRPPDTCRLVRSCVPNSISAGEWQGRRLIGTAPLDTLTGPRSPALVLVARHRPHSVAIYVVSLAALFGTSTAYHRLARSSTARRRLRRLDHSMISVLIAGTYTPCVSSPSRAVWGSLLAAVWGAATAVVVVSAVAAARGDHRCFRLCVLGCGHRRRSVRQSGPQ